MMMVCLVGAVKTANIKSEKSVSHYIRVKRHNPDVIFGSYHSKHDKIVA